MKKLKILIPIFLFLLCLFPITQASASDYEFRCGNCGRVYEDQSSMRTCPCWDTEEQLNEINGQIDYDALSGLQPTIMRMVDYILSSGESIKSFLTIEEDELPLVNTVIQYFSIVGICLLIIYFLMDYSKISLMQGSDFTLKSLVVSLLKLGVGWVILACGNTIISGFLSANNAMINWAVGNIGDTTENLALAEAKLKLYEEVKEMRFFACLGMIASLLIVELGAILGNCIVAYQAISRKLELLIRTAFSPIALADCYNGEGSAGVRYLKKLFSVCLWGFGMILVIKLSSMLSTTYITNALAENFSLNNLSALLKLILFPLATGGMCAGIKQICNDALGC